jgi:hypothetical protein
MIKLLSALCFSLLTFGACAHAPGVTEAGAKVDVGRGDPPPGMTELGAFEAMDPLACPTDGKTGTEEAALVELRNRAAELRADYVQIFRTDVDGCKRVVIRAMAFKRSAN